MITHLTRWLFISFLDTLGPSNRVLHQPSSNITGSSIEMRAGLFSSETGIHNPTSLPPLQDLDVAVIECLPPEVVSEINDMYGGKLLGFISESKSKTINTSIHAALTKSCEGKFLSVNLKFVSQTA